MISEVQGAFLGPTLGGHEVTPVPQLAKIRGRLFLELPLAR